MHTSGLALAEQFYRQAVAPIVDRALGSRSGYAAALIGPGSEILGLDTVRSRDHDWGPRCQIFLDADAAGAAEELTSALAAGLPVEFGGFPTGFSAPVGDDRGAAGGPGPLTHRVEVHNLRSWWSAWAGGTPTQAPDVVGWLSLPTQRLAELTAGAVFHDGPGTLTAARAAISWYPDDVWRYVLACGWRRIAEEQPFVGRCAEVGDDLGSRLVTAGIVREAMRLRLLLDRVYPPYSKWLGTAFAAAADVGELAAALDTALAADDVAVREDGLVRALGLLIERQNGTGLGARSVPSGSTLFFTRPFRVVDADGAADALSSAITDPALVGRSARAAIDSVTDNVAITGDLGLTARFVDGIRSSD